MSTSARFSKKIGLIGAGNMGTAILSGLLEKELILPDQVWVFDKAVQKSDEFADRWKIRRAISAADIALCAQVILLAVKPQDLEAVAAEVKPYLKDKHLLISILAGTPLAKLKTAFGENIHMVRAMPNLGAKAGESMTVLMGTDADSEKMAEQIFLGCGKAMKLDEKFFDLATALSGSGPAYFFLLMEMLVQTALVHGLSKEEALRLIAQTSLGAAALAQPVEGQWSADFAELRERVTSKGGTTEAAVKVLEEGQVRELFQKAFESAIKRSQQLSQK